MVVVRESPRAKLSPDKNTAQWPPKSPFQALLSSPSGRKRWQDQRDRHEERSPSPSPLRKPLGSTKALRAILGGGSEGEDGEDDTDEDVETLQLQMQMIEAKLKLKELKKKSKKQSENGDEGQQGSRAASRMDVGSMSPQRSVRPSISQVKRPRSHIEVPLSPTKDRNTLPQEHGSPARRRLGIDVPAKAQDVSLKRARDGTQLKRPDSVRMTPRSDAPKIKSFSERLQASKQQAEEHEQKYDRIERSRSKAFNSGSITTERSNVSANELTARSGAECNRLTTARETPSIRRMGRDGTLNRTASRDPSKPGTQTDSSFGALLTQDRTTSRATADAPSTGNVQPTARIAKDDDLSSSNYDPLSEIHLSKRHVPHVDVARAMEGKEIYTIPRLLKEVVSPHYDPPDCEDDFVVFAVLASKSSPFDQKATHHTSDEKKPQEDAEAPRNKFMVLKLTDLTWELDCFLFGTGFDQFWKLTPGTLLAILNPAILPPKTNQHNGRFSLKLSSSEDQVLEIGMARDLGYCTSVKKDGEQCGSWIDKRHTEICEFHLNLFIDKQRKHRMEVNGMWRGTGDVDRKTRSQSREGGGWDKAMNKKKGVSSHREYGTLYSVPGGMPGKSAASLLDAEDMDALHDMTKEEASRKRIAEAQKERDLRKRLGEMGSGMGAEYLRATDANSSETTSSIRSSTKTSAETARSALFDKPKASELGLLNNKASATQLGPAKDRKHHFGTAAISSSGREAIGWSGAYKAGLLQPRGDRLGSPEKGQTRLSAIRPPAVRARSSQDGSGRGGSLSPTKKRARFALEKGIREPGRESLGEDLSSRTPGAGKRINNDDDDDDDLDIV